MDSNNKSWYKRPWGIIVVILLFPFFIIWYTWAKAKWNKPIKVIVTILCSMFILGAAGSNNTSKRTVANTAPPETKSKVEAATISTPPVQEFYTVSNFVDGDTVKVKKDQEEITLRLIGIDTPETKDPRTTVECFGEEASQHLQSLIKDKKLKLEADATQDNKDKYDRFLRYIFLEDGTNINQKMISDGYANEYTYNVPYMYQLDFKSAEKKARDAGLGLWSLSTCNGQRTKPQPQASSTTTQATQPQVQETPSTSVYYANCTVAKNAGAAPIYKGQPGYRTALDRDNDGVACE